MRLRSLHVMALEENKGVFPNLNSPRRDETLEESDNLPVLNALAQEIVEDLNSPRGEVVSL